MSIPSEPILFIAEETSLYSSRIIKVYPDPPPISDLKALSQNIFKYIRLSSKKSFKISENYELTLTLPIQSYDLNARVKIESPANKTNKNPAFIIVLLIDKTLPEGELYNFDGYLKRISNQYKSSNQENLELEKYFNQIQDKYINLIGQSEIALNISDNYTLSAALEDFKSGLQHAKNNNNKIATRLLLQSLDLFKKENIHKLICEAGFLAGSLLFKQKKYKKAANIFNEIIEPAKEINHQRYLELAPFMEAYCRFYLEQYQRALQILNPTIEIVKESNGTDEEYKLSASLPKKYLSAQKYWLVLAQIWSKLKIYEKAIAAFEVVIKEIEKKDPNLKSKIGNNKENFNYEKKKKWAEQYRQVLTQLGRQYQLAALRELRNIKQNFETDEHKEQISKQKARKYFRKAKKVYEKAFNISKEYCSDDSIFLYDILENILSLNLILENFSDLIEYLKISQDMALNLHDFGKYLTYSLRLTKTLLDMEKKEEAIKILLEASHQLIGNKISSPELSSQLYHKLGEIYHSMKQYQPMLEAWLTALNFYEQGLTYIPSHKKLLTQLLKFYKEEQPDEIKVQYYQMKINELEKMRDEQRKRSMDYLKRLDRSEKDENMENDSQLISVMEVLEDFWIFSNDGLEIYHYSKTSEFDSELFGGFLSAFQSFSKEIASAYLNAFEIGLQRYLFHREEDRNYYIIGWTHVSIPHELGQDALKKIDDKFYEVYHKFIDNFFGDVKPYQDFGKYVKDLQI